MNTKDLLIGEGDGAIASVMRTVLGVEREQYVCETCNEPCDATHVHDPKRAAFDGGESPAWTCGECGTDYVRETDDSAYTLDLYGRDPPQ
jgi:ribosomal protein L37AE/L43A